jgi:tellurite resistance protein TerC
MVLVETSVVLFAVDSIPEILVVTLDQFIIYTSKIFGFIVLRYLYFLLAGLIQKFHFLQFELSLVLVFVGVKMLIADLYHIPIGYSLGFIAATLITSVVASLMFPKAAAAHSPVGHDPQHPKPE